VSVEGECLGDRIMEITGGTGAYAAIECVGGDIFAQASGWGVVGVRWGGRRDSCR
jgi:threonine dehydrogenase-like Zn-dependent dehydrogenase